MTTILSDFKLGVMVSDSSMSDGDRVWGSKKVWRVNGALIGMAGEDSYRMKFIEWYRCGMEGKPDIGTGAALILTSQGLFFFDKNYDSLLKLTSGREAIGTGGKSAMCVHEALGFTDPRRAVRIVCKHDAASRVPVRSYKL